VIGDRQCATAMRERLEAMNLPSEPALSDRPGGVDQLSGYLRVPAWPVISIWDIRVVHWAVLEIALRF
jgi:hypothetical protein